MIDSVSSWLTHSVLGLLILAVAGNALFALLLALPRWIKRHNTRDSHSDALVYSSARDMNPDVVSALCASLLGAMVGYAMLCVGTIVGALAYNPDTSMPALRVVPISMGLYSAYRISRILGELHLIFKARADLQVEHGRLQIENMRRQIVCADRIEATAPEPDGAPAQ
jgi:hypothetical protein